jgi:hypothetical protein
LPPEFAGEVTELLGDQELGALVGQQQPAELLPVPGEFRAPFAADLLQYEHRHQRAVDVRGPHRLIQAARLHHPLGDWPQHRQRCRLQVFLGLALAHLADLAAQHLEVIADLLDDHQPRFDGGVPGVAHVGYSLPRVR